MSIGHILTSSDMITVLPRRVAQHLGLVRPLVWRSLPFPAPAVETGMVWQRRMEHAAGHRWLRDAIVDASRALSASVKRSLGVLRKAPD
jgi:DNA-binding transcriptional LysR family regulator